ncbi:hypothetical protein PF002_g25797 [Phytophthora fragariae]|uniref:Uncharacterized protein n=1 Tax=Phytophthora fragariae TaxID=53985 RepID=A0A6A3WKJ9_9STRA|nr:hypothetical protein PF002_g25797 [Phytophthora fragariae]
MRFWWPEWQTRERSPSSDSECSTASHSSLASDASFYSAASDGAGAAVLATARAGADPLGLGLRIVDPPAPVLGSAEPEMDPADRPRALPVLGTCTAVGAATSGTGPGPAAPIARQPAAGLEPAGDQASPSATSRRFEDRAAGGRSAGRLPDWVAPGAALAAATARALAVRHGPSDPDDDSSEDDDPDDDSSEDDDPDSVAPTRPGRAGGMLPAGRALAAPLARAPAATPTAPQHHDDPSAGTDAEDGHAACSHPPPRMMMADPAGRQACCPSRSCPGWRRQPTQLVRWRPPTASTATQPSPATTRMLNTTAPRCQPPTRPRACRVPTRQGGR